MLERPFRKMLVDNSIYRKAFGLQESQCETCGQCYSSPTILHQWCKIQTFEMSTNYAAVHAIFEASVAKAIYEYVIHVPNPPNETCYTQPQ